MTAAEFDDLIPEALAPRSRRVVLQDFDLPVDIGFHDFEVGTPQRLLVTVEIWLDEIGPPGDDRPDEAWDYDLLRCEILRIAGTRRYNLQETLVHAIYDRLAAMRAVKALRVKSAKPDIYKDAQAVGVEIASFTGLAPDAGPVA